MTIPIVGQCRASGLVMTRQRRLIAEAIFKAQDHPDILELHRRVRTRDARISRATVYRTAKLLARAGILERRCFHDGHIHYEPVSKQYYDYLLDLTTPPP